MTKYFNEKQFQEILGDYSLPVEFSVMSTDSYNEDLIAKKILSWKNPPELLGAAINMAIVGYGNKKYGSFKSGKDLIQLSVIFKKYNVLFSNDPGTVLKEDDLTPGRLCRFFRYHIRNYIKQSNNSSYLYKKYSDRNPKFRDICFRGAEYIDELTDEEAKYLIVTTGVLDNKKGTAISERLIRVFDAKGRNLA